MNSQIVGLNNLGNTCFLNTCIQLIVNVKELNDHFISNKYIPELNYNFKKKILKKLMILNSYMNTENLLMK